MCASMHACGGLMAHSDFLWSHTHMKALSTETPPAPSQEDPITACASIKTVPPSALWLLIAISSPQWVPTQAAQVRLCNWPPEKQHNGVNSVYAQDKTNLPLLNARFPLLLVGKHILACYVLNVVSNGKTEALSRFNRLKSHYWTTGKGLYSLCLLNSVYHRLCLTWQTESTHEHRLQFYVQILQLHPRSKTFMMQTWIFSQYKSAGLFFSSYNQFLWWKTTIRERFFCDDLF